ncbi:hypothetical protein CBR_g18892, partial [Chara braunii]
GESIYGDPFADEVHSRLRFNHRGILACANAGKPNSNNSQFFITLDKCDWLDRKHTIFGKVTGDTIYNLVRLGELETEEDDRPVDPPKIISVEVLWNPFDDIVPREDHIKREKDEEEQLAAEESKRKSKRKGTKNLALLSFGEEAAEEEQEISKVGHKIKSSHDLLDDPRLIKSVELDDDELQRRQDLKLSVRQALKKGQDKNDEAKGGSSWGRVPADTASDSEKDSADDGDGDDADFDARMRRKILEKRKMMEAGRKAGDRKGNKSGTRSKRQVDDVKEETDSDDENEEGSSRSKKKDALVIKKKGMGSVGRAQLASAINKDTELMTKGERVREQVKQRKRSNKGRESEVG